MDSIFLTDLKNKINLEPKEIIKILGVDRKQEIDLGFDYKQIKGSTGKGYVSIFYNIILENDNLIAYELVPQLPKESLLTDRYLGFYKGIFEIDHKNLANRYYNFPEMVKTISGINVSNSINEDLRLLMTPFAGTDYGTSSGWGTFLNRELFNRNFDSITPRVCELLLESKNPATRLMAIEFYNKKKKLFNNTQEIERKIESIYLEVPNIRVYDSGCSGLLTDSRVAVEKFSSQ